MHRTVALVALAALASGCGYSEIPSKGPEFIGQSYPEAIRVLCDVDKLAGIAGEEDPLAVGRKRTDFIQEHVENPDGIYLRTLISVKGPSEQAVDLRQEAKETGLERCALADDLEKNGTGGLSP
jgi:hypothetical protein